jgi:hypothetical protein
MLGNAMLPQKRLYSGPATARHPPGGSAGESARQQLGTVLESPSCRKLLWDPPFAPPPRSFTAGHLFTVVSAVNKFPLGSKSPSDAQKPGANQ